MSEIVVTREQAAIITSPPAVLKILDPDGKLVGYTTPSFSAVELAEAEAALASDQPRYTTEEVLSYLRSLEKQ
jgi:hypothetical protein